MSRGATCLGSSGLGDSGARTRGRSTQSRRRRIPGSPPTATGRRRRARARRAAASARGRRYGPPAGPQTHGPGEAAERARRRRRGRSPSRPASSQPGISPKTMAPARASTPANRNCVSSRSMRYGRSPTSSRNSTQPVRRVERVGRAHRRRQLREVAAEERPGRLASHQGLERGRRKRAERLGASEGAHEASTRRSRQDRRAVRPPRTGRAAAAMPHRVVRNASSAVMSL